MTNLEQLIQEKCPNGVEYKTLGDVTIISKGIQFNKKDMNDVGTYPVINGGINPSGYIEQYNCEENTITVSQGGASAGYVNWIETKFWCGAHCYTIKPTNEVLNRYVYHFVKSQEKKLQECQYGAGIPALSKSTLVELSFPVPPLEVQREIVEILDKFTLLTAELTAELTARKEQFEYYRNDVLKHLSNYKETKLEELCEIITKQTGFDYSATIKPSLLTSKNGDCYSFIQNKDFSGTCINFDTDFFIPVDIANRFPKITLDKPSLLISISGKIGNVALYDFPEKAFIGGAVCICKLKDGVNGKYLLYYLESKYGQDYLFKSVKAASHLNITVEDIRKAKILLPSLEEQQHIVDILDRFDTLCNDISSGLPAEIEARQKQYEYYRDKLLTFKRV